MQSMWRTQVKRITIAIIAAVAIAGGVQIANEGAAAEASRITADATTQPSTAAAPTPTPTQTRDVTEWG
ncbi:hypothetical protein ACFXPI_18375 [Streptomyces sp. NPDC059104]|uniref:hypothetical protein n=1 Tax=Streptomyces sp. NPDC059104 TaxID=3346729 RepID=UPI003677C033